MFWCIIAGARDWNDYATFSRVVTYALSRRAQVGVITGGATGTDTMAMQYAIENGLPCRVFRANWRQYGLSAGWRRNMEMHQELARHPHKMRGCLCFWNGRSGGTSQNFRLADMYNTPLRIYSISASKFIKLLGG